MANILDVSAITERIKARVTQIEEQLKQHQNLTDELERLRSALARLEGEIRTRVTSGRRGRQPASAPKSTAAPKAAGEPKRAAARTPRGQWFASDFAIEISKQTGIGTGTVSTTLTKMAKAGEIAKADRGYALPQ